MKKITHSTLLLIVFLSSRNFANAQKGYSVVDQTYHFSAGFIKTKFLINQSDSLVFRIPPDTSVAVIDHVWSSDTTHTWILVHDENLFFFNCAVYCDNHGYQATYDMRKQAPAPVVAQYFKDHKILLANQSLYFIGIKPITWANYSMGSYLGWDFLLKVSPNDLDVIQNDLKIDFDILPNNFH